MSSDSPSSPGIDEPRLSWQERELLAALRRLANAQAQLHALEEEQSRHPMRPALDAADVERVESLEAELAKLREKAGHRFGRSAARDRISEVESQQRLVLERVGFDSYADFAARDAPAVLAAEAVDPALVEFARHELEAAEEAYAQVLALPGDLDAADADGARSPSIAAVPDAAPTIDLTGRDSR
jgi:hypothetical protein